MNLPPGFLRRKSFNEAHHMPAASGRLHILEMSVQSFRGTFKQKPRSLSTRIEFWRGTGPPSHRKVTSNNG